MLFEHGPEYKARLGKPFVPPTITLKEIHAAVPKHLLRKNAWLSAYYCVRDVVCCAAIFYYGFHIETILANVPLGAAWQVRGARAALWLVYWIFQGLSFASFFCIAHELGHQTLFDNRYVNDTLGYVFHAAILAPFFAWKASHNAHHRTVASIERDENYVPYERSDYPALPPKARARTADYLEVLDETPLLTVARMLVMQCAGWWLYLSCNVMGSKRYSKGTNHFSPYSPIFRADQRLGIFLSDIGLLGMGYGLYSAALIYGWKAIFMYYFVPYVVSPLHLHCAPISSQLTQPSSATTGLVRTLLSACPLISDLRAVMLTFLHHSDPTIPHYRGGAWSWVRGAAATVDRPLLGWAGRFFLHNVSHDHVAHHFFSYAPFYNQPEITKRVRAVLQEHYNYDSTNTFYALYRSFTQCVYVDDDEPVVFYRNRRGESVRGVACEEDLARVDAQWDADAQDAGTKVVE
ncbi:fatty acid desaturase-domain-containing protein [Fomitopsis betulina]|nr:fatty acid desaturase-domain-containing protein [Fomitopsis betulina]